MIANGRDSCSFIKREGGGQINKNNVLNCCNRQRFYVHFAHVQIMIYVSLLFFLLASITHI